MKKIILLTLTAAFFFACESDLIDSKDSIMSMKTERELKSKKGGKDEKVTICHKGEAITVSINALEAHLAHGDYVLIDEDGDGYYTVAGACGEIADCDDTDPDVNVDCGCEPAFYQDFETDFEGWFEYPGPITIDGGTALIEGGAFTRFDGYQYTWLGTWSTEINVFLDPAWNVGTGFDYSVASSRSTGAHLRDYIFHVGVVSGKGLLVNGSNNTDGKFNSYKLENENEGSFFEVTSEGWYTLQHKFYDIEGSLAVDMNLINSDGVLLWTVTRTNTNDIIPDIVGGNRYGWFIFINVDGGILTDESKLFRGCE